MASIFKSNYHIIANDQKLKNVFPSIPLVSFRRKKSIRNFIINNDVIETKRSAKPCSPCKRCKSTCHLINTSNQLINNTNGNKISINAGGDCKTQNVIYAARCKKHDLIYIGHTGDKLSSRFSKHRYDLKSRPDNNELTKHLNSSDHDFEKDIDITILKSDIPTVNQREFFEDKFICKLGTLSPNGLNADTHQYAKDMYSSYRNLFHWRQRNLYIDELYCNVQSNLSKKLNSWLCHTKWRNVEKSCYFWDFQN